MGHHLTKEILHRYQENRLDVASRLQVALHLKDCSGCVRYLWELGRAVAMVEKLPTHELSPAFTQQVMAKLAELEEAPMPLPRWQCLLLRAVAPAIGVLGVLLVADDVAGMYHWVPQLPETLNALGAWLSSVAAAPEVALRDAVDQVPGLFDYAAGFSAGLHGDFLVGLSLLFLASAALLPQLLHVQSKGRQVSAY